MLKKIWTAKFRARQEYKFLKRKILEGSDAGKEKGMELVISQIAVQYA
ncbi:hypothetical protein RG963_07075 [Methanosarcina sp. Z-7115]|uniref:Uncharacterized protein n=1 Tax=Methanosarcina baikalica TaxID=3073890 RepID=A0ABU2D0M9_9EURY|nr:hypothetical protein [Methanosarcina sp. Z-7115]MDR7665545.1 hypothetical protein [Methanosarcina sp. Z-7115]